MFENPDALKTYTPQLQQLNFKALMNAFAYPGRIQNLHGQGPALEQVLATLIDGEVGLADPDALLNGDVRMRLEARMVVADHANFVVCNGGKSPAFQPMLGTLEEPEYGATLVLQVHGFDNSDAALPMVLKGPGIEQENTLHVTGLNETWLQRRAFWNAAFPTGVDFILVSENQVVALPRTTQVQGEF
ncbi:MULTISPECIES: phosphonate C-P lyase system protein PhnH [unclassified Limnobacter]|uniref:phosphonate C-P lyase system protein PhnH n=1 Tax=unclassified Limnobacter TaxID=2630203 RepID=UPI000C41AA8A|nr:MULTISPECIES: phosphonate C-P lyase system protein PhnH [unclassified Limnobacter]MAG81682.1 phosphonate C-P lyase system protein PhnH [Sutterellaceae bacterium]MBT84643.1 phosphonate C-P lyase system protein PhnH [Sutterellaceae bacterium]HAV74015.1 phosphonate C-P lyase system protein PhnH [Limnobacter sp.]|tara:strand:+ start:4014 stop:4577 length:564 start_codon:yes stop_codon:yes gene_type:complete